MALAPAYGIQATPEDNALARLTHSSYGIVV